MGSENFKILLVDDEPDILEIISYTLKSDGYLVYTAENGVKAIELAKKIQPDLIILDVMMPEMDGIEACEIIRNDSEIGNSLIVFLSARGEDYSQIAGFNAGADDYITKPIKPKVLKSKIKSLLRRITKEEGDLIKLGSLIVDRSDTKSLSVEKIFLCREKNLNYYFCYAQSLVKFLKENLS